MTELLPLKRHHQPNFDILQFYHKQINDSFIYDRNGLHLLNNEDNRIYSVISVRNLLKDIVFYNQFKSFFSQCFCNINKRKEFTISCAILIKHTHVIHFNARQFSLFFFFKCRVCYRYRRSWTSNPLFLFCQFCE